LRISIMPSFRSSLLTALAAVLVSLCVATMSQAQQRSAGEVLQVTAPDGSGRALPVRLLRPAGAGPFRLAIINHGSPRASERATVDLPVFRQLSEWLMARGYAVALPLRRGYGAVGGKWDETFGRCDRPDYVAAGNETARDIEAVMLALTQRPEIQKDKVLVIGQSAGAWGTLAFASYNPPAVAAYVNFAGGRGGRQHGQPNQNCTPDALVQAAAKFGATVRQPTLWLYSENDSYFAPDLVKRMHGAFTGAGGKASLHMFPPVGEDGHRLIGVKEGMAHWAPVLEAFVRELR
jgi:dienelactone hydrolase